MIETRLDQMLAMLRSGDILGDVAFTSLNMVEALNIRESDTDRHYYQNELDDRWRILPIHPDLRGVFKELHTETRARAEQQISAALYNFSDRDSQTLICNLSDRIQQEIGQIAKSRATEYPTPWHDALWSSFARNEIPMIVAEPIIKEVQAKTRAGKSKEKCLRELASVHALVNAFVKKNKALPTELKELSDFAMESEKIDLATFEKMMFNERDGKQFEISWTSQVGVIVDEAVGVNGERLTTRYDRPYLIS